MDTYNEWTILESYKKNGRYMCLARCSCGVEKRVNKTIIVTGKSKMCRKCSNEKINGGPQHHRRITGDHLAAKDKFSDYKASAKKRGISFDLSFDVFKRLAKEDCFYCGGKPSNVNKLPNKDWADDFVYNGIDRLDNNKGYRGENVLACCKYCNYMKRELTYEEFFERVNKISTKHPPGSAIIVAQALSGDTFTMESDALTKEQSELLFGDRGGSIVFGADRARP